MLATSSAGKVGMNADSSAVGMFFKPVHSLTGQFGTTLVDQNSNAVDHATLPDVLLASTLVHSTLVKFGTSSVCNYNITVENPLESSLLLNLQQDLPAGAVVIAADGASVSGNQMLWELNLPPGGSRLIQTTLCLPSGQSNLTNTALSAYDSVNADWLQFQSTPATVQVLDWPASIITPIGLTANGFEMSARHFAPGAYQSQWTTNFIDWNSLQTTTNAQGVIQILDAGAMAIILWWQSASRQPI